MTPSKLRLGNFGRFRGTLTWFHCVLCLVCCGFNLKLTWKLRRARTRKRGFPCTAQVSNLNLSRLVRKQRATINLFGSTVISFYHSRTCVSCLLESKVKALRFFNFAEMGSINFHAPSSKTLFPSPHLMTHVVEGIGDGSAWKRVFAH